MSQQITHLVAIPSDHTVWIVEAWGDAAVSGPFPVFALGTNRNEGNNGHHPRYVSVKKSSLSASWVRVWEPNLESDLYWRMNQKTAAFFSEALAQRWAVIVREQSAIHHDHAVLIPTGAEIEVGSPATALAS